MPARVVVLSSSALRVAIEYEERRVCMKNSMCAPRRPFLGISLLFFLRGTHIS